MEGAKGAGALVRMASQQEAASAIEGLHQSFPLGAVLPLLLRYADTPEEKARKVAKRDRNGMTIQHFQPSQSSYGQGPPMQQPIGAFPMQQASGAYPMQQAPAGAPLQHISGGYPMQQLYTGSLHNQQGPQQAPQEANGAAFPMQPQNYMQQQQPQQPALSGGMQQLPGYFSTQNQGNPASSMQSQPAPSDYSNPMGASIPGLGGPVKQEPATDDFSGFGAPGGTGMNGQYMPGPNHSGPMASNSMNGSFMPAAAPAGLAGPSSMNGSFMPAPGLAGSNVPFMESAPYNAGDPSMQGFGQPGNGMFPIGQMPLGPGMQQGPGFGSPGQMPLHQQQQQQGGSSSSLYVKNLPQEADKLYLYERFAPHGAILGIKVLVGPETGKCKGVAFVNYATCDAAMAAIEALHGTKLGDKVLHVSMQMFRGQRS